MKETKRVPMEKKTSALISHNFIYQQASNDYKVNRYLTYHR